MVITITTCSEVLVIGSFMRQVERLQLMHQAKEILVVLLALLSFPQLMLLQVFLILEVYNLTAQMMLFLLQVLLHYKHGLLDTHTLFGSSEMKLVQANMDLLLMEAPAIKE